MCRRSLFEEYVRDRKHTSFKCKLRSLFLNCVRDRLNLNSQKATCDRSLSSYSKLCDHCQLDLLIVKS
ncbi:MAG: hypothetical protein ACK5WL_04015 [Pseudanabaena sp.]